MPREVWIFAVLIHGFVLFMLLSPFSFSLFKQVAGSVFTALGARCVPGGDRQPVGPSGFVSQEPKFSREMDEAVEVKCFEEREKQDLLVS